MTEKNKVQPVTKVDSKTYANNQAAWDQPPDETARLYANSQIIFNKQRIGYETVNRSYNEESFVDLNEPPLHQRNETAMSIS